VWVEGIVRPVRVSRYYVGGAQEVFNVLLGSLGPLILCGRLFRLVLILATIGGSTTSRLLVGRTA
jgi:hypothetical protein